MRAKTRKKIEQLANHIVRVIGLVPENGELDAEAQRGQAQIVVSSAMEIIELAEGLRRRAIHDALAFFDAPESPDERYREQRKTCKK